MGSAIVSLLLAQLLGAAPPSTVELQAKDFSAAGDGFHDDVPALRELFAAASRAEGPCPVVLESGRYYYLGPHQEDHGRLMPRLADHVAVEGNDAVLLVDST